MITWTGMYYNVTSRNRNAAPTQKKDCDETIIIFVRTSSHWVNWILSKCLLPRRCWLTLHLIKKEIWLYSDKNNHVDSCSVTMAIMWLNYSRRLDYLKLSMLKSMLFGKASQTWPQIGWQQSQQPIRSRIRKSSLTNINFNMAFS